jgi:hypothetical protein
VSKKEEKNNTDDLINQLCGDLEANGPRCPYRRILVWLLLPIAYIVGVILYSGVSLDLENYVFRASFIFEISMAFAILIASALASSWLSFPDCIQRDWMKVIATTLFGSFLIWIIANGIEEGVRDGVDIGSNFFIGSCSRGLAVEFLPFIALIYLSAKGHTTQPYWSMAMNIMAVSALGWIGLRLTCSMYDSMTYGFIHYLLPFAILGAGIGFFARKIFKW